MNVKLYINNPNFYHVRFPWERTWSTCCSLDGKEVQVQAMPKILSCDWSTRFMRVILLGSHWSEQIYSTGVQRLDYSINVQQYN
jgi:hypothetical protein